MSIPHEQKQTKKTSVVSNRKNRDPIIDNYYHLQRLYLCLEGDLTSDQSRDGRPF